MANAPKTAGIELHPCQFQSSSVLLQQSSNNSLSYIQYLTAYQSAKITHNSRFTIDTRNQSSIKYTCKADG